MDAPHLSAGQGLQRFEPGLGLQRFEMVLLCYSVDSSPSFLVSVEDQRVRDAGRLLRVLQVSSGSITIYGKINGVQGRYISRSERNFADSLENAFGEGNDQYLDWLAYDALKPSELDKGDFQFFENVSKVSASFEPDVTAKISAIEQVDNSKQWKIATRKEKF